MPTLAIAVPRLWPCFIVDLLCQLCDNERQHANAWVKLYDQWLRCVGLHRKWNLCQVSEKLPSYINLAMLTYLVLLLYFPTKCSHLCCGKCFVAFKEGIY